MLAKDRIKFDLPGVQGPGTYPIGKGQAALTQLGFDTLSPPFVTVSDSSGHVTIESFDLENGRITGNFGFTVHLDDGNGGLEFQKELENGSFDLPIFE